eukprot:scaffold16219_cov102-Isochrysis_galbana.AAC.16
MVAMTSSATISGARRRRMSSTAEDCCRPPPPCCRLATPLGPPASRGRFGPSCASTTPLSDALPARSSSARGISRPIWRRRSWSWLVAPDATSEANSIRSTRSLPATAAAAATAASAPVAETAGSSAASAAGGSVWSCLARVSMADLRACCTLASPAAGMAIRATPSAGSGSSRA